MCIRDSFDIGFLDAEWQRLGHGPTRQLAGGVIDTLLMAKEMYPGKRNGLDALCERLGVDNSSRTLHGALLDAELLAEVYICLTRGQDSLLMELDIGPAGSGHSSGSSPVQGQGQSASASDWSHLAIPLLQANPQELQAHEALLLELDQASKGKTLWRKLQPMPA